jgi:Bacterial type II and III secretion system protein
VKSYLVIAAALAGALATPASAQEQKAAPLNSTLKVQLVLSRYQGDKKISTLPYTVTVNADDRNRNTGRGNIRVGTQVPITTMVRQSGDPNGPAMVPTVQYRDVGTSIDCTATPLEDGRYKLDLTVEDSSIEAGAGGANTPHPSFRSFRTNDSMLLRDGQSAQYSTATDKVSGEVWKVDVTLTVVK